jgi:hypothetical protein
LLDGIGKGLRGESMKKEEARRAVLSEYDRWAKKHPNEASMMGGFLFFDTYKKKGPAFSISVRLATSGKSFTAGFETGWKISALTVIRLRQ